MSGHCSLKCAAKADVSPTHRALTVGVPSCARTSSYRLSGHAADGRAESDLLEEQAEASKDGFRD